MEIKNHKTAKCEECGDSFSPLFDERILEMRTYDYQSFCCKRCAESYDFNEMSENA